MLSRLIIRNYAIIPELDIAIQPGLTIITGETGAGKSILLGALGYPLILTVEIPDITLQEVKFILVDSPTINLN